VDEVVREGLLPGVPHLFDEPLAAQLLQGPHGLFLAAAARLAHCVEIEGSPDDGGGAEQLPASLADSPQAPLQEVAHPTRQRPGVLVCG
jgi:hypothetical protein